MVQHLEQLKTIAEGWGGRVTLLSHEAYDALFRTSTNLNEAPFSDGYGVHWDSKTIFVDTACPKHKYNKHLQDTEGGTKTIEIGSIIHEMGHCFATTQDPEKAEEWDFLGWEVCLARQIGGFNAYSKQNSSYGLGSGYGHSQWGETTSYMRRKLIADRIAAGKQLGIIDKDNRPLSIR